MEWNLDELLVLGTGSTLFCFFFFSFIHVGIRVCGNILVSHLFFFYIYKKEGFWTTICFLCKGTQWFWNYPNPRMHHTSSLTFSFLFSLLFCESEEESKTSLRITEKECHMCECVCVWTIYFWKRASLKSNEYNLNMLLKD